MSRSNNQEYRNIQARRIRRYRDELKKAGCSVCGYDKCLSALEFHHINPDKSKTFERIQAGRYTSVSKAAKEFDKCLVLCANCHREAHAGINGVNLPERDTLMPKDVYEYGLSVIRNKAQIELFGNTEEGLSNFKLAARDVIIRKNITEEMWTEMYSPEFWDRIKHYPAAGPFPGSDGILVN